MHGLGNDFVIINNFSKKFYIDKNLIKKMPLEIGHRM